MSSPARPLARARLGATLLTVALLVTACGGSATPAPSPTPAPTAVPTPTPFDVALAFVDIVSDPDFSARMEIDGTMNMGVSATMTGTITGAGDDSQSIFKIGVGGMTIETESISSGGKSYTRTAPGPWLEAPAEAGQDDKTLNEWLRALASIKDLGVVTKNGKQVHHLSGGDEPLPPSALGIDSSTFKDPVVTIEMYATDDGTPAIFTIEGSWIQVVGGQDLNVEFLMDLTFSNVGSAITIDPPTSVWTTYESPLGYSMAHPATFTVENREDYDAYILDGADWIYVAIWPDASGLNAEGFRDAILDLVKDTWGAPPEAPTAATLGGEPGYEAVFKYLYDDGTDAIAYDVMAMHANLGWDVTLYTLPGEEDKDYALFQQFLATFAFGE